VKQVNVGRDQNQTQALVPGGKGSDKDQTKKGNSTLNNFGGLGDIEQ